jgi:hypothetical protein
MKSKKAASNIGSSGGSETGRSIGGAHGSQAINLRSDKLSQAGISGTAAAFKPGRGCPERTSGRADQPLDEGRSGPSRFNALGET